MELWDVLDKERNLTGETMERGWLKKGQFHLIVNVWIQNDEGKFLISKRTGNKRWPHLWGCTIGSAIKGDDSITTALKETTEELGITLNEKEGYLFKEYINYVNDDKDCGEFIDVYIFNQNVNLKDIILQEEETVDVMWASKEEILTMMENNEFIPLKDLPYFSEFKLEKKLKKLCKLK